MKKPDHWLRQHVQDVKDLFAGDLGQKVLADWMELFVHVTNDDLNGIVEGERSFVLNLKEMIETEYGEDDDER